MGGTRVSRIGVAEGVLGVGVGIRLVSAVEERLVLSGGGIVSGSVGPAVLVLGELVLVVLKLELVDITSNNNGHVEVDEETDGDDDGGDDFLPCLEVDEAGVDLVRLWVGELAAFEEVVAGEDGVEEEAGCGEGDEEDDPCERGVCFYESALAGDGTDEAEEGYQRSQCEHGSCYDEGNLSCCGDVSKVD